MRNIKQTTIKLVLVKIGSDQIFQSRNKTQFTASTRSTVQRDIICLGNLQPRTY